MTSEIQKCSKTCVITGASSGIGKATAMEMAKLGFEIIMVVRNSEKSRKAYDEIKSVSKSKCISIFYTDLASFESIRKTANEIKKQYSTIDILINNAGLFKTRETKSVDGFESMLAVNYLAPFLLTNLLLPAINKDHGRIINVSSEIYKRGSIDPEKLSSYKKFNAEKAYANSKLLLNYFTVELALRLAQKNIAVNCVHPGVIATDVMKDYPKWLNKIFKIILPGPKIGAKPILQLATIPQTEKTSGKYFYKLKEKKMENVSYDTLLSEKIWNKSIHLTKLNNNK